MVLSNQVYREEFDKENPNQDLLRQLVDAGVEIYVCGQALPGQGYKRDAMVPEVQLAVAALTVLPTYQLKGYALLMY